MTTQILKAILDEVENDIIVKRSDNTTQWRVDIYRRGYIGVNRVSFSTSKGILISDPRLLQVAIKRLRDKAYTKLGLITADALRKIPFTIDPRYNRASYIGDTRYTYMDAEEVDIQIALGIPDPSPVCAFICKR